MGSAREPVYGEHCSRDFCDKGSDPAVYERDNSATGEGEVNIEAATKHSQQTKNDSRGIPSKPERIAIKLQLRKRARFVDATRRHF